MTVTIQHSHALSDLLSLVISVEVREEFGFELLSPALVFICYTTISVPFHVNNWERVPGNELKMCTIIPEFNLHPVSPVSLRCQLLIDCNQPRVWAAAAQPRSCHALHRQPMWTKHKTISQYIMETKACLWHSAPGPLVLTRDKYIIILPNTWVTQFFFFFFSKPEWIMQFSAMN